MTVFEPDLFLSSHEAVSFSTISDPSHVAADSLVTTAHPSTRNHALHPHAKALEGDGWEQSAVHENQSREVNLFAARRQHGTAGRDRLVGNRQDNIFNGRRGNDILLGRGASGTRWG